VVLGGIGTVIVAGLWSVWFPGLRTARRLDIPQVASLPPEPPALS